MPVEVSVEGGAGEAWVDAVTADAERLLAHLGAEDDELSVLLCDDDTIRALNRSWRGKDEPTDVLSFPQADGPGPVHVLGDLVIDLDVADRQARELGHPLAAELRVLLVHGLCHLLGHDHHEPEETVAMRRLEAELLATLGEDAAGLVERADR